MIFINFRITDKWIMVKGNSVNNFCIEIFLLCCVYIQMYFTGAGENLITTWNDIQPQRTIYAMSFFL